MKQDSTRRVHAGSTLLYVFFDGTTKVQLRRRAIGFEVPEVAWRWARGRSRRLKWRGDGELVRWMCLKWRNDSELVRWMCLKWRGDGELVRSISLKWRGDDERV